ncbi:hypothetical protein GCM10012275_36590 [Longimycelium tulufanense]|uniref:Uncharacterized protein n=1 Tax=Longimycelium tulufanense TaxID=907463 RepID=A0A8J3FUV8_9PSEU|nr:hypothetical protein GCM10012275_36590 [Longimycelium tulufanense]
MTAAPNHQDGASRIGTPDTRPSTRPPIGGVGWCARLAVAMGKAYSARCGVMVTRGVVLPGSVRVLP